MHLPLVIELHVVVIIIIYKPQATCSHSGCDGGVSRCLTRHSTTSKGKDDPKDYGANGKADSEKNAYDRASILKKSDCQVKTKRNIFFKWMELTDLGDFSDLD
jgi:hypothetical protein